ncbi:hypothetical protein HDU91_001416, partial [Kappamyces sp. JEL0680]
MLASSAATTRLYGCLQTASRPFYNTAGLGMPRLPYQPRKGAPNTNPVPPSKLQMEALAAGGKVSSSTEYPKPIPGK